MSDTTITNLAQELPLYLSAADNLAQELPLYLSAAKGVTVT